MRIWDIKPDRLCRNHLLGEHRELHAIWQVITGNKKGYAHHPETMRWRGKLNALYRRHQALVAELICRDYQHLSPLDRKLARGEGQQKDLIDSISKQRCILKSKKCSCRF
jgi:hypothetical protein